MYKLITSEPTSCARYMAVNGKVIKMLFTIKGTEIFTADARLGKIAENALIAGSVTPTSVDIKVGEATEADLLAAQKSHPGKMLELEKMISYMKACKETAKEAAAKAAQEPIRVEITNAREVGGTGKIIEVSRNGDGTIAAATVRQV
ncbi:MAG TPA: hypothetical protein VKE29_06250 [Candidatus Udaeobacter sp.]|nr:hypothetical protein [Candidatus Udaeobacter sp.]